MSKNIGIISGRLGGIDGVSLETDKWVRVLKRLGHDIFLCTGEIVDGEGYSPITGEEYKELKNAELIKEMSFFTRKNKKINRQIHNKNKKIDKIDKKIKKVSLKIIKKLKKWISNKKINLLIIQNASAMPMQIPLGVAIHDLVKELSIETIFHHHDFSWERERYNNINKTVKKYIEKYFPFDHEKTTHIVINSIAKKELKRRKNIESEIIPNVFDFSTKLEIDDYNKDFRKDFDIREDSIVISVPVRIVERKNIETAIKITADLEKKMGERMTLIFGYTTPGKEKYANKLRKMAKEMGINFVILENRIAARRKKKRGMKLYTPWDIYPNSDFVIYPSNYEGWGNALLEAIAAKKLIAVKKYPVYKTDIGKYGFEVVGFEQYDREISERICKVMDNQKKLDEMVETNFKIAREKLSLNVLKRKLKKIIDRNKQTKKK